MKTRAGDALVWSLSHHPATYLLLGTWLGAACAAAWVLGRRIQ